MDQNFTIRIAKSLMDRINGYAQSQEIKRAEAIRNLIEIGLRITDLSSDNLSDIDEEFKKMQIEMYVRQTQQYLFTVTDKDKEEIKSTASTAIATIQKKYPEIFEKYYGDPIG